MFVVDTNILVYAAEKSFAEHAKALTLIEKWMKGNTPWFVTWGNLYEFMRITTHPAVFARPWTWSGARSFVEALLSSPSIGILTATPKHLQVLNEVVSECGDVAGNTIHDAHTAVLMREHGIREIRTRDKHFQRFPFLKVVDPLK